MRSNNIFHYQKFLIFLILSIYNFYAFAVNFDKASITKLTFINNGDDSNGAIFDININFNLFDSRNSTAFLEKRTFILNSNSELFFDVSCYQNNFDNVIRNQMSQEDLTDEHTQQLKRIFGCIKSIQIKNRTSGEEARLYIYGAEDGSLKVFVLNASQESLITTVNYKFDYFHINFNAAIGSQSEYYRDCINAVDKIYRNGTRSNLYHLAFDCGVTSIDFIERMRFLYETYFPSEPHLETILRLKSNLGIKKCLFQIWIGTNPIPDEYKKNQIKWQSMLPSGWTYKLYTDEDVEKLEFSDTESKKVYDSLPNKIAQSDLLRMEILNKYGGVYVDLDTEPFESIDFLASNFDFFGMLYGPHRGGLFIDTYFIGSIPEHPIIKQVIKNIVTLFTDRSSLNHLERPEHIPPNILTSIIPLTRAVYQHAGRSQNRDILLPVKYFNNYSTSIFSYGTHYPKRLWKK